jgi:hypothetical protein
VGIREEGFEPPSFWSQGLLLYLNNTGPLTLIRAEARHVARSIGSTLRDAGARLESFAAL